MFNLCLLNRFFVEVEYNNTENKIINLSAFKAEDIFDKFSNLMDGLILRTPNVNLFCNSVDELHKKQSIQ
jgi:hypothetical protein